MSALRTAAQQALGILCSEFTTVDGEFCRWCDGRLNAKHNCALEQSITALRAALAQQEEPVQEPVATLIAQRDALLEALKPMIDLAEFWINHRQERRVSEEQYNVWIALGHESSAMLKARAAIKAVEENT